MFNVFDTSDPDWFLVGDARTGQMFGFVPSNYIDLNSDDKVGQQALPQPPILNQEQNDRPYGDLSKAALFAPPPVLKDRSSSPRVPSTTSGEDGYESQGSEDIHDIQGTSRNAQSQQDDEPPPMPTRPSIRNDDIDEPPEKPRRPSSVPEEPMDVNGKQEHNFDGEYFTWYIDEVDGRKKKAVVFSIGQGRVILKPNTSNPKKYKLKSTSSLNQNWAIRDLLDFSHEKKHVFLEFKNPPSSIELHAGSKDVAEAIVSILGDIKGAEEAKGLREVAKASKPSGDGKKVGRLMYDFDSQGDDELDCKEGDEVYILNESKSKDWWLCENVDTGKQGVVPSSYIEVIGTSSLDKLKGSPLKKRLFSGNSKGRIVEGSDSDRRRKRSDKRHYRSRDERDRIREHDRARREQGHDGHHDSDKSMPNYHRVRTWIDSTGSFKVEAEFLGCVEGKVQLHKTNGVKIAVAASKLSLEDLEYVEKVTGTSLENYKEEVQKQNLKRSRSKSATAAINDVPPVKPSRPKPHVNDTTPESSYDWFEFFLSCGVDIGNCQRYTLNFSREKMDENILEDINPSLLRTLGLREGDIIRVMKYLDNKFGRKRGADDAGAVGSLFTEPTGALKNNSSSEVHKIDANALSSQRTTPQSSGISLQNTKSGIEDDAWAVKPAARSNEDLLSQSPGPQKPQYTGSLLDLLNIKPIDLTNNDKQKETGNTAPSAQVLTPTRTGANNANTDTLKSNATGSVLPAQKTGGLVPVQKTGNLIPVQPTGFVPITAQPTGFVPIQATGIQVQPTIGIIPVQTGISTFPSTTLLPQQRTGGVVPQTTFGQAPAPIPQTTFGLSMQKTGPLVPAQRTGGAISQGPFDQTVSSQLTGTLLPQQVTGGATSFPQTTFGQPFGGMSNQATGFQPQTTFGQPPLLLTGTQNTGFQPQSTFGQQFLLMGPQSTGFQPQSTFGQQFLQIGPQNTGFQFNQSQPQNIFQQQQMPPQTTFGNMGPQNTFGQVPNDPNMNSLANMFQNTTLNGPANSFNQPLNQTPLTSFGQPPLFGFNAQPLQSQPTGAGFGNAPSFMQPQQTGRKANLQAATPDNPFGF